MLASKRVARIKTRSKVAAEAKAEIATKAVAYLRVSTEEQAQHGHGLAMQDRAVRAFATSQGYDLVEVITDAGVSGATKPSERAGYAKVLAFAASRSFSVLLVYKFDRLARQIVFAVTAANDLAEQHGVVLRSVAEPIDTSSAVGRMMFSVLAGMAEQERQVIIERTHGGRREKASKGGLACGAPPFGYRAEGKALVPVERDAETVRRIYALRAEGLTLQVIADRLNGDRIPTKRGGSWRPSQVGYILDNPRYRGTAEYIFIWGTAEPQHVLKRGKHKAIIT